MIWSSKEISSLNYGKVLGEWESEGICIDSRNLQENEMFVACNGEKVDGHNFISKALAKGAKSFIANYIPEEIKQDNVNCWLVDNVIEAINILARHNRKRAKAKFIGVTGSVGKTSVKEALKAALSTYGKVFASTGNYNNHLGLPISLASMPVDTDFGVFEMGMSARGEIKYLTDFIVPDVAIITKIAPVHIEFLGTIENIAHAKSEIFLSMNKNGVAILNGDSPTVDIQKEVIDQQGIEITYLFGESKFNDAFIESYKQGNELSHVIASFKGEKIQFELNARGRHQATNMLSVLLAIDSLGLDISKCIKNIESFSAVSGRGETKIVKFNHKELFLFDESYNSSPDSLEAALRVMGEFHLENHWKRKIAILSDMRELGDSSKEEHEKVARYIQQNKIDKVITVGVEMENLSKCIPTATRYKHFDNKNDLIAEINELILSKDVILIKGSLGTKIFEVVNFLEGK